jgi:hypothetical protein
LDYFFLLFDDQYGQIHTSAPNTDEPNSERKKKYFLRNLK